MAVTLADVAARARVSAATVSRVLNGNYPVAQSTRSRVLRAVEELEYVVNGPASALAAASSDLVGILVNDIADPFFGIIAGAVQAEMVDGAGEDRTQGTPGHGQKLAVVCNTGGSSERELTYLTLLQRQRAGAVVLVGGSAEETETYGTGAPGSETYGPAAVGTGASGAGASGSGPAAADGSGGRRAAVGPGGGDDSRAARPPAPGSPAAAVVARLSRLAATGTRVVLCGRPPLPVTGGADGAAAPDPATTPATLAFDNHGGARRLTEHLLSIGHRRIGYVTGPPGRSTTRHRLMGHLDALAAHGVPHDPSAVAHGAYDRAGGYDAACELMRRAPGLTAIVAANDAAALGVSAALRDAGLRIPQDVSVAGFDDLPFCADTVPALTTVRLPLQEAGARAGRLALGRERPPHGNVTTLRADLMVRQSTAAPGRGVPG
ncbi:LacI family DNA-binding transcriptional regulator [Streptomyces sp. NPDC059740]|uniref:LacI family DNA-binding transcriptional regulator n=1 Tax=Streptomyces sp. NPDC059740 TaxID=3346926 RepID=UPI00364DD10F